MAVSFSDKEKSSIITALLQAAGRHATLKGMRKTTVDELAAEAGISKGAFYKFYSSKEHLFLEMLEQWHAEISRQVTQALAENEKLPPRGRAALMLKIAWRAMREHSIVGFCRDDLPFMLRKLPEKLLRDHYQSNEDFIRSLMEQARVKPAVPEGEVYAAIRILMLSLLVTSQVGENYGKAMDHLIDGACELMIQPTEIAIGK
ncbi:MAG: TetR/AcrR family transcriptional regulator [Eubacteriales bacterium]|nr:TetR/AcrR family transcriptional regulator [Eubacteriales bacterium]